MAKKKPINIQKIMDEAYEKLLTAYDFMEDEMSPQAQDRVTDIVRLCGKIHNAKSRT